ncbi:MAG: hypothetical protein GX455_04750 [Phycisphaerae bacterium]|nr:hypothetical protein [Phycisphaerae bacterium]
MNPGLTRAIFGISITLSLLAGMMAYLITYEEYRHHYCNKPEVMKAALKAAGFAFVFFLGLGVALGLILPFCF